MSTSSLNPDIFPVLPDRSLGRGHGTGALGPSDTSDSGSDVAGAAGLAEDGSIEEGSGSTSDLEHGNPNRTAGPDLGDADLDSDTDSGGTGERAASGRDAVAPDGADIDVDHVETILPPDIDLADLDMERDLDEAAPAEQVPSHKPR